LFGGLIVAMGYAVLLQPAAAATVTFVGTGSGSDGPLSASAAFTTSAGSLSVTLTNLLSAATIVSAGQAVSDLSFTLSNLPGALGATSATGTFANFNGTATPTLVPNSSPTRWLGAGGGMFSIVGNTITLEAIGGGQPDQLILPAGITYPAANASITNNMFSPFVDGSATFNLALLGITADTTITGATFSFGTKPDTFITGVPSAVPLPGTLPLFATGLLGLWALRRKRKDVSAKSLEPVAS
jgi:hypothetical protein